MTEHAAHNPRFNVLLIDDDTELAAVLIKELEKRNYIVSHARDSNEAVARMGEQRFDLLILDRMLPGADGINLIETFRSHNPASPILVISALDHVDERVFGLQSGADDYLIKPFSYAELGARVDALIRRSSLHPITKLQVGPLTLDLLNRVAILRGEEIELSAREYQLLEYFMARPGQLITKQMLLQNVWKYRFPVETNVVDVHLSKLRQKIEKKDGPCFIRNVRAQGYVFGDDA
ncbi:response regulator transcription factor [Methylocystis sp. IM3]|uniref:response regulator transcription factor n=1 Tax=unclassified Methylocystis TaxID=2625913 RepID=UPI0031196A77